MNMPRICATMLALIGCVPASAAESMLATVYYVDDDSTAGAPATGTSWTEAFDDLQKALKIAGAGDAIHVAGGLYVPTDGTDQTIAFPLPAGVVLRGGFAGWADLGGNPDLQDPSIFPTVLSGNIGDAGDNADNSHTVVVGSGIFLPTLLDGFIIESGNANGADHGPDLFTEKGRGGGLYISGSDGITVTRCTFRHNAANGDGAGVSCSESMATFRDCSFDQNRSWLRGGGLFLDGGTVALIDSELHGNSAASGAGVYVTDGNGTDVVGSRFAANDATAGGGGVTVEAGSSAWTNCVFTGNTASDPGAGFWNEGGVVSLTNCTFVGNSVANDAGVGGAGLYNSDAIVIGHATVTNCVFWGNADSGAVDALTSISTSADELITVAHSCVEDDMADGAAYPGTGNIDENPLFGDTDGRLSEGSPCTDAGDETALPADVYDLDGDLNEAELIPYDFDGNRRVSGATVDMGAFELRTFSCVIEAAEMIECLGSSNESVLDGSGSSHPDDLPLTYHWAVDCPQGALDFDDVAIPVLTVDTSAGCSVTCLVTLTVQDTVGADDPFTCSATIIIADTTSPNAADDIVFTNEGQEAVIAVLDNDTDAGAPLPLIVDNTLIVPPEHGKAVVNPDGTVSYTPGLYFSGADSFTYTAYDDSGNSDTATVEVTVIPLANAPTLEVNDAVGDEDTAIPLEILAALADTDGSETLAVVISDVPQGASLSAGTDNHDGTWTLTTDQLVGLTIAPPLHSHVDLSLGVAAIATETVNGDTATTTASPGLTVTIIAVNDAPLAVVPGGQTADEDTDLAIRGISVADIDVDEGTGILQVSLSVGNGTLALSGTAGLVFSSGDGTDDVSMTFAGATADVNAALDDLGYHGNEHYNGSDTLTLTVDDQGNAGKGGALSDTRTIPITVTPVNDPPVTIVPSEDQIVDEDTELAITGVSVSDVDVDEGTGVLRMMLSVTSGALTLCDTVGLVFESGDGVSDPTMTFSGTPTALNSALATITYLGDTDYHGPETVLITADDTGNTGSGGVLSDTRAISIDVIPVNDVPVANDDDILVVNEDTLLTFSDDALLANDFDVDFEPIGVLSFTQPEHGTLVDNGGGTFLFDYTPDANFNGVDTFHYVLHDFHGATDAAVVSVTVNPVNDAPVVVVPGDQTVDEDIVLTIAGINVSDVDAGEGSDIMQTTLSADDGVLTLSSTTGLAFSSGDGTDDAMMTFMGTTVDINAALADLRYRGEEHYNGPDTLTLTVDDQGNAGSGGILSDTRSIPITVNSVNDAPDCDLAYTSGCDGATTALQLDGSGSSDIENDALTYLWTTDCSQGSFDEPSSPTPLLTVGTRAACAGACDVMLTVDDGDLSTACTASASIIDTDVPTITCDATGGTVSGRCTLRVPFTAQILDNCCVDVRDVQIDMNAATGNVNVTVTSLAIVQTSADVVTVDGMAVVSASRVTEVSEAVELVVSATDCCGNTVTACTSTAVITISRCRHPCLLEDPPPGDFDCDGDVDLIDFVAFDACLAGPSVPAAGCDPGDFDEDGDVDLADFAEFACYFLIPESPVRIPPGP